MKKRGILNSELLYELTKLRHTDKFVICDAGFPIPEGKKTVDVSLVAGIPSVEQVFKAVCNEIMIEAITVPEGFKKIHVELFEEIRQRFVNHEIHETTSPELFERVYDRDVKLFIRTGDVRPCGNMLLTSASGVPRVFDKYNVDFETVE